MADPLSDQSSPIPFHPRHRAATCQAAFATGLLELIRCDSILVRKHQSETAVSRLTITLSEARYRALKEASAQRAKTIGQLIDESLEFYGIKSREDARDLVRRARVRSRLSEEQALKVAQGEVQAARRKP
jgi:hypothetical protein